MVHNRQLLRLQTGMNASALSGGHVACLSSLVLAEGALLRAGMAAELIACWGGIRATGHRWWETGVMARAEGFDYSLRGDDVVITHHNRKATVLRGAAAAQFLSRVEHGDPQLLMARATGQYAHGNERTAGLHPRNRGQ